MIEQLEQRRHLSASYALEASILRVVGTPNRDEVAFGLSPDGKSIDINIFEDGKLVAQDSFPALELSAITAELGAGADTLIVGEVPIPALVLGGPGPDSLSGGQGNDTLLGQGGDDYLFGREGDDSLVGGLQADLMLGGRNDDFILALSDLTCDDSISGGRGEDTVDYSTVTDDVFANVGTDLPDPSEDDRLFGDIERLLGSPQNDTLINGTRRGVYIDGRDGDDLLVGGSGNDTLLGGRGGDTLLGKGGRDWLDGQGGPGDVLNGGRDSDVGVLDDATASLVNVERF